jgi:glucose/mannose transport system substrate-binding protein
MAVDFSTEANSIVSDVEILGGASANTRKPVGSVRGARLRQLVALHEAPLARYLARLGLPSAEVDDALQEVLIIAARKLDRVRPGSERAFLFATAVRVARNARRGSSRRDRMTATLVDSTIPPGPSAEDLADQLLGRALLDDVLEHMPAEVLLVFLLAELEEMPVPMVAQRLGLRQGTVASRLRRARVHFEQWSSRTRTTVGRETVSAPRQRRSEVAIDPEVLNWWVQRGEAEALRALLGVYERSHPSHRTIASSPVDGSVRARAQLSSRMLDGKPPDTFQVNGGTALLSWVRRTTSGDQMDPLDFLFASEGWTRAFPADVLDLVTHRGRLYAVPLDIHRTNLLFYSERIFSDNGLRPPSALDDLHAVAEILRGRGVVPFAMGFRDPWTLNMLAFEAVLVGEAGPEYYREFFAGRRRADDPEVRGALAHVARMLDNANGNAANLGWEGALDLVSSGRAAMTIAGDWGKGYLLNKGYRLGEDFGMTPSPGRSKAFVFATDVFGLPKRASHPGDAIELLKVFGSKEGQDAFNHVKGSIPARVDIDVSTYDTSARSTMRDFRSGPRVPSMASIVPTAFLRALDAAMSIFARTRNANAVLSAIRANYDLLGRAQ